MKRILLSILIAGALTACGGGSSSTPVTQPTPTVAPTGTPTTTPEDTTTAPPLPTTGTPTDATLAEKSTQQSEANQGLSAYFSLIKSLTTLETESSSSYLRRAAQQLAMRGSLAAIPHIHSIPVNSRVRTGTASARIHPLAAPTPGACTTGSATPGLETGTADGPGTYEEQITNLYFYDAACTQLEENQFEDIVGSADGSTATGTETSDIFTSSNVETGYVATTLALQGFGSSPTQINELDQISLGKTDSAFAGRNMSCNIISDLITCGGAAVVHLATDTAYNQATSLSAPSGSALSYAGNDQIYVGAAGTLSLVQGSYPAWDVSGDTGTVTSSTVGGSLTTTAPPAITVTDATNDATFTLTVYANVYQGILRQTSTGTVVAVFNVDGLGNGTVTYSDASTGFVQDFFIVS